MGDLLIRDLPDSTHTELKRRAEHAGMSLQAYITKILERDTAAPALDEWLRRLDQLPRHRDLYGAEVIRAARDELP
jgi:hypothetical protein